MNKRQWKRRAKLLEALLDERSLRREDLDNQLTLPPSTEALLLHRLEKAHKDPSPWALNYLQDISYLLGRLNHLPENLSITPTNLTLE